MVIIPRWSSILKVVMKIWNNYGVKWLNESDRVEEQISQNTNSNSASVIVSKWRVDRMDADTSAVKKNTNEIQWKGDTEIWKAKGKAIDTNTGSSPGYQSQPNSLETHLVRKWGNNGRWCIPSIHQWMDGWNAFMNVYMHVSIHVHVI